VTYVRLLDSLLFWLGLALVVISLVSQGAALVTLMARGSASFPEPLAITIAFRLGTLVGPLALLGLAGVLAVLCEIHDRLAEQLEAVNVR
jgi:hypothetical protein